MTMREAAEFKALFTPFTLAGKRLRNRITHASMSLLATPAGHVTERLVQYHANRDRTAWHDAPSIRAATGTGLAAR
jgi:hypothetical protein